METQIQNVRVGVAAVISDQQGRVLFGRCKGSHGAGESVESEHPLYKPDCGVLGQWAFPGGHLEFGETYFQCAEREALEETGLRVKAVRMITVTNYVLEEMQRVTQILSNVGGRIRTNSQR